MGATRRSTGRSRHRSILPSNPELAPERVWVGRRGDQQPRVLVAWSLRYLLGRSALDDLALVHDQDLVGEVPSRGDVVRDVEDREVEPRAKLFDQVEHPEPDRNV